jgi:putative glutamine amidotransferase
MKPIIGITVEVLPSSEGDGERKRYVLDKNYPKAIEAEGGNPIVILPETHLDAVLPLLDGWLIPGGRDIDASEWGESNHPSVSLQDPARLRAEKEIFRLADPSMPILGICYGCQLVNVLRGGSLEQHLPDRLGDRRHEGGTPASYAVEPGSILAAAIGEDLAQGRSYHHQGVAKLGAGLRVTARHEDGTIEAIEATDRPWLVGVQWHPERTLEDESSRGIFRAFVEAAARYRAMRSLDEAAIPVS